MCRKMDDPVMCVITIQDSEEFYIVVSADILKKLHEVPKKKKEDLNLSVDYPIYNPKDALFPYGNQEIQTHNVGHFLCIPMFCQRNIQKRLNDIYIRQRLKKDWEEGTTLKEAREDGLRDLLFERPFLFTDYLTKAYSMELYQQLGIATYQDFFRFLDENFPNLFGPLGDYSQFLSTLFFRDRNDEASYEYVRQELEITTNTDIVGNITINEDIHNVQLYVAVLAFFLRNGDNSIFDNFLSAAKERYPIEEESDEPHLKTLIDFCKKYLTTVNDNTDMNTDGKRKAQVCLEEDCVKTKKQKE